MNYAYGRGVPEDYQKAVSWLRKASDAGDAAGMNNMGVMYANGYGVTTSRWPLGIAKPPKQAT